MTENLGLRLVNAGRISRELLGLALSSASARRISEAEALVELGVEPALLARTGADASSVPLLDPLPAYESTSALERLIPGSFARRALVVPLRVEAGALICAFADPTAKHQVDEVSRMVRRPVRPVCASVPEILGALRTLYGSVEAPTPRSSFTFAGRASFPEADERAVNLRPDRPQPKSEERKMPSGSFEAVPPAAAAAPVAKSDADALERWDVGPTARAPRKAAPTKSPSTQGTNSRRRFEREARPLPQPHEDVGAALATVRSATNRERVVEALLNGSLAHARQAFCFRLRDGRLEGVDSAGSSLGALAVRRIVLPVSPGSTMHQVLMEGRPHFGALYAGATDQVLRAAIGSRGGRVSMHGIWIDGRPIALLVADDVRTGELGHERLGALAHAAGSALRRLLVERA